MHPGIPKEKGEEKEQHCKIIKPQELEATYNS